MVAKELEGGAPVAQAPTALAPTEAPPPVHGTQHEFGWQWARYPEVLPEHREQFRRWIAPFPEEGFAGKRFLDLGCGAGRNSHWALVNGATGGIALDYDERTVAQARQNLAEHPGMEVRHQSAYELADEAVVDVAFSIGVIHHLAEPKRAVANMVRALKPGGSLVLWVYAKEGNERYLMVVDPLRKWVTTKLPAGVTRLLAKALSPLLWAYIRLPHSKPYLLLLREKGLRQLELIILDQLIPSIAFYWTREETLDLVAGLPVEDVRIQHTNGMSWSLVATKRGA